MKDVFKVDHVYELNDIDECKFIGIFSTLINAEDAVNKLIEQPGFREHPIDSFQINKIKVDRIGWQEGFFSYSADNLE